ncbi:hypothetical protein QYE76_011673 [Lolium multiflorum]|uniref:Uncharacterized protein n=1 Tax=Lolium multiflorum TaxID=4521 RepID=A0AAD8TXE3_LOLMU|nr:hypothetical protein QYE76_052130 [Lolium multiflorum]KAK1694976.1 hypothetical protein QYE76_011673 [Lolium multiflorum]
MAAADLGAAEWERSKITNQDLNLLKKLGITKKPKAVCFPSEESYPTPPMGYRPNWALWKRIFFCRRNGSANVAYNIGGVVISVRSSVNYFDVKLPDSVQGWRKKWLYIREENDGCAEDNIPPFDGAEKILRRRSWDAEATEEERTSTEALMTRIHELQNTRGKELSGIQITAYFLKTRVQPLQARKNPFWNYAGDEDTDRLSTNLEAKDLDKLIRRISSLKKKDSIPSTYRVKPYSAAHALPKDHPNLVSLPPLPEGGDVEERAVISDDNPDAPSFANEPAESRRSAGSDEKEDVSEATASAQSLPPAVSPRNKRKRDDVEDSGTSKVDEAVPSHQKAGYDPYLESIIKKLIEANERADTLALKLEQCEEARKKAESDAVEARQEADKAKADAAGVEDLRKRLHDAETSLSDHITAQSAREAAITKRIKTQSRRFVDRTSQEFELEDPDNDALLDAVSFLEFHGSEAREGMDEARAGLSKLFPYFFPKKEEPATFLGLAKCFNPPEDLGLKLRHENMKIAVESTVALVADSQQTIDWAKVGDTEQIEQAKWRSLIKAAKLNTKKILAYLGIKPSSTPSSSRPEV